MKHFFVFALLLFLGAPAFTQTIFTAGITYCNGAPTHNPGSTGSRFAIDTVTFNLYIRSTGTNWTLIGRNWPQSISGCAAPAYTPTKFQSNVAINACTPAEMYIYDGSSWNLVGGSGGLTGTGLANRLAYWTASGAIGYESTLLVDTVNNRLKIGDQTAPSYKLDISDNQNESLRISSSATGSAGFILKNTSVGGKEWLFIVGGSAQPAGSVGDFFYYNNTDAHYSSFSVNTSGESDFFLRRAADVRFYNTGTGSQVGKVRATDALIGMPFFAAYNDVTFGLAQTTSGAIKGGLNMGPSALLEWASSGFWYSTKDVGFSRQAANTLNLSNGSTGLGKLRLDKIVGTGATSATYAVSVVNSNDSTILLVRNDRRAGINTATPDVSLDAGDNTDAIKIPAGTTAQEPAVNNTLRFNSDRESLDARENGVMFRLTSSKTPSIAAGAAAGTGPTIAVAGNDLSMKVTLTTGTTATTGALFTVTYASSMDAGVTNYPVFSCADVDCTGLNLYVSAESNTAFTISTQNAPTDAVQYIINIHIGQ